MPKYRAGVFAACALLAFAGASRGGEGQVIEVVRVARSYDDGGGYNKTWQGSGTPEELRYAGEQILAKGEGTYCCGFTLTVALKVAERRGLLEGKSADQLRAFQKEWYGVPEPSQETLCVFAVEKLGIGHAVKHEDAQPGDFLQFWRTSGSGHSVIFLKWVTENDEVVGFEYRSSQGSTDGIGDRVEYFSDAPGRTRGVVRKRTHFCRLQERRTTSFRP